jgi:hypothetical protein
LIMLLQKPAYLNFIDYFRGPSEILTFLQPVKDEGKAPAEFKGAPQTAVSGRWPPFCQGCLKSLGF